MCRNKVKYHDGSVVLIPNTSYIWIIFDSQVIIPSRKRDLNSANPSNSLLFSSFTLFCIWWDSLITLPSFRRYGIVVSINLSFSPSIFSIVSFISFFTFIRSWFTFFMFFPASWTSFYHYLLITLMYSSSAITFEMLHVFSWDHCFSWCFSRLFSRLLVLSWLYRICFAASKPMLCGFVCAISFARNGPLFSPRFIRNPCPCLCGG